MGPGKIHINEENFPLTPPHSVSLGFLPWYGTSLPHYPCGSILQTHAFGINLLHPVYFNSEFQSFVSVVMMFGKPFNQHYADECIEHV